MKLRILTIAFLIALTGACHDEDSGGGGGKDADGDGVVNASDLCPNTPEGETVDADGCAASQLDEDGDGVSDALDQCPGTPAETEVGADGCPAPELLSCAEARVATEADLLPGPIARGTVGDIVIENDKMRAIIQKGGRNWYNISQFGGNIIDALPKNPETGALLGTDQFEEFVLGTNIESAPNYQVVKIVNPGGMDVDGNCVPAVVRAEGFNDAGAEDDLIDFINGSSAIRALSIGGVPLQYPPSADDVDLPLTFATDYTLDVGNSYIQIDTHMMNDTGSAEDIYLVEYVNGSGEVELFQHGYGFGEAFATAPCAANRCNFMAYAGHEGGDGVSYGIIHKEAGTSTVSVSGVSVFVYGRDMFTIATTPEATQASNPDAQANYSVPANGSTTFTRYFAVGNGTVSSIVDVRNQLHELATGTIEGTITETEGGAPVEGAEIVMISAGSDGFGDGRGPDTTIVNHFRTDSEGRYSGTYPPGDYTLEVNVPGRLAATPSGEVDVTITADEVTTQDFTVPRASFIRVQVKDGDDNAIAAKVQLVGDPQGPDTRAANGDNLVSGNQLNIFTGFFGDRGADPLPPGIALAEFAVSDPGSGPVTVGDTGPLAIEPGTYTLSVSRGPRYSHHSEEVTIVEGQTLDVSATLHEIMPTPNHIFGDFHIHSSASPDSEVTNRERVATYISEDLDFFTPSDHGMRMDFSPIVADMGVGNLVATAPSAEVTTFDYGHFNFWPVAIETDRPCDDYVTLFGGSCDDETGHSSDKKIGQGSTDWGGLAPYGEDFPSAGNFSKTPADIFGDVAMDPFTASEAVVRQINHIDGHFNAGGLGINTGTPGTEMPTSSVAPASRRLDPAVTNHYSDDYESLEILIGTDGLAYLEGEEDGEGGHFYDENLGDWFNLLNKGLFHTGISNSDTHTRRITSMHTRNVISVPEALLTEGRANMAALQADPHAVGDSVIAGLTTMSTAPFLKVKATKDANVAGLEVTDAFGRMSTPLLAADGAITVDIEVESPIWAPYDQIMVLVNGATRRHTNEVGQATNPARYFICGPDPALLLNLADADFTREEIQVVPEVDAAKKYKTTVQIPVTHAGGDYWFVVLVRGTSGVSPTMFPIAPNDYDDAGTPEDPSDDTGVHAMAMSNPIFVDVDGGGWTAPGVVTGETTYTGATLPPSDCPNDLPAP